MRGPVVLASTLLAMGCESGSAARERAADSTAVSSVVPVVPAVSDSAAGSRPTPAAPDSTVRAAPKASPAAPAAPHIGYDSAIVPRFTVDSTGKLVPIRSKKP